MKIENITRTKITASEGMALTNGTEYTLERFLLEGENPKDWDEIPKEEYDEILKAQEETAEGEV